MRHMGFPLAWKSSQSWHFHQRTLYSETSNCCLPCTTLPFLPWPLPREVYVVGVSSANDRSISSVIDHPPPIISPCGLLTSFVNNLPLPTDKVTPSLLLSCLKPLGPCPDLLRTLGWLGLRSLSFQSRLQSTFYQTVPYGFQFPPNHCFQRTTVYMRQSAGERKGRISSQEPDNSWGRAGNGDLRKCGMLKCLSSSPHGIPRHPQLRMCIRTNTYILSLLRGFLKTGAKLGSENI